MIGLVKLIPKVAKYVWRGAKSAPNIIFGKGADAFVKGTTVKNAAGASTFIGGARSVSKAAGESWISTLWKGIKQGGRAAEASAKGFTMKSLLGQIKSLPKTISNYTKAGIKLAGKKGTSKLLGGLKGFFKGIGKKMPLIGNLMLVAFELPNIISATKEKGLLAGIGETLKAGVRLTAASIGCVALSGIPVVGPILGFMAGDWLASKVVGKSYSEKKAQQEQQMQELAQMQMQAQPQVQPQQAPNTNPYGTPNPATNPFGMPSFRYQDDIMAQGMRFNTLA